MAQPGMKIFDRTARSAVFALLVASASPAAAGGGGHHGGGHYIPYIPTSTPNIANQPSAATSPSSDAASSAPVTPVTLNATSPMDVFARIQAENDKILTTQGQLAEAQDRLTNLTGITIGVGLALLLLFAAILFFVRRSAVAATAAARALPILERAYVFPSRDTSLTLPDNLGPSASVKMTFNVLFANHGRTPAVVRWVNIEHQYLGEFPEGIYEDHERHGVGVVIGAGESRLFTCRDLTLPRSEWQRAETGDGGVYLHGRVVYRDVFSIQHETYFCWRYDIPGRTFSVVESEELNRYD